MNGDEFIEQIQDVQKQVAELQQDATRLPPQQQSRLTESLERLTQALRDIQVAEDAIRLLLSAVQQSRDSIVITTAQLNSPGPEIVYVNPAFEKMTGYQNEEVLGKTPRILQGEHTDQALLDDLRAHLEAQKPFHGEAINYHKDGTEFYVEWNITPIQNTQGKVTHFVAIQRNISDRKTLEIEREQLLDQERTARDQAEVANRSKDEFLTTLSHELRTPLTPILGWSRTLQTKELPPETIQAALATIEQNAKRQVQLVDDLLDLSRIVQGKLTLNLESISLAEPIRAAIETVRFAAEVKQIQIQTRFDSKIDSVMGDVSRLQQVFWNLLTNAIKFTPTGGQVWVKLQERDRMAHVEVQDTGQGINPEFLPFVFDRFRQEDSSLTRQFGGLGLGLSICRQLIEAHGGTIAANSAGIGQGSTFTVSLPLVSATSEKARSRSKSSPNLKGSKILVIEDDPSTLDFIAFLLQQEGAIVTGTNSATSALEVLNQNQFDVLVSDIGLQEIDGYKLLRKIRDQKNLSIPAIALTAYATERHRQRALEAGYQQHLAKPIEPEALVSAIATILAK